MRKNYLSNNNKTTEYGTRTITDFERRLYLSVANDLDSITEIAIKEDYFTTTYTRSDLERIGEIVAEEQYYDWLLSQGEDAFEAECESQQAEQLEYEKWMEENYGEGVGSDDAA